MKILRRTALMLIFSFCFAHLATGQTTIRIKIQASSLDRSLLFQKLNDHGADHHMHFVLVDRDFDYRVAYGTAGGAAMTPYGPAGGSASVTKVFDPSGAEVFEFSRNGRATNDQAANATAKEIIKRIRRLRGLG
ncbi:MAG: hypothetical protein WAL95_00160 [Candidatus Acidiferrales bacterium]